MWNTTRRNQFLVRQIMTPILSETSGEDHVHLEGLKMVIIIFWVPDMIAPLIKE